MSICLIILLGGKGVRVSTPFITTFQRRKLGICPNPPQILMISKPVFFLLKMWQFQNFFFPSWKCRDLVFFLEIFQNIRFTMYVFMGDFSADFRHKKNKNKNKNSCFAPLCVCLLVVKQLQKFHLSSLF